ncbi:hypothetical protein [Lysinibacillus agricola]|uniref:hypothetical protein n=1 Tax=Lysinibacillus agricola TaxID=2590012 RepID=UPI003C28E21A
MNSFVMRTDASTSLNFLIYIQNIFLNQNRKANKFKYPNFTLSPSFFKPNFENRFKTLWSDVCQTIDKDVSNDFLLGDFYYQELFNSNEENLQKFNEIRQSFQIWWDSLAGQFSIERSIDEQRDLLYQDLKILFDKYNFSPEQVISVYVIYDDYVFETRLATPYFIVASINTFYIHYKNLLGEIEKMLI